MRLLFTILIAYLTAGSLYAQEKLVWMTEFNNLGSFSSPRATDLNGDGTRDIVLGAGRKEFIASDSAVIAVDGKTGAVLWTAHAYDQIYGSANFQDITGDGIMDIFINGRSGVLKAIDGKSGKEIWNFIEKDDPQYARSQGWYNFYNLQFIQDLDNDGFRDILISNGGDVTKAPYDPDRPTGNIVLVSGASGELISKAPVPDGKETYLSPVIYDFDGDGDPWVIYGTGGETLAGALYAVRLSALQDGDISGSLKLADSMTNGFIAPPVLADITGDGIPDIIVLSVDGRLIAINGKSRKKIWTASHASTEGYASPAVGQLNGDGIPDFFTTVNTGIWPDQEFAVNLVVDGKSGQIIKGDTIGYYQIVSPLTVDIDNNGIDEVILHTNFPKKDPATGKVKFSNTLVLFDFQNKITQQLGPILAGSNGSSTPWIGDLDGDGYYDLVNLYQTDEFNESIFSGFRLQRINLGIKMSSEPVWGSYMGSSFDGIWKK